MKHLTRLVTLAAASLFALGANAQAPKFVLLEEFTGMNCVPCSQENPGFLTNILTPNPIVVHHIAYHPSWPGTDIMYTYNKPPVDSMVMQYLVSGVPDCMMLGNQKHAQPASFKQADIDAEFSSGSPIKVQVVDTITSGNNHVAKVTVTTVGTVPSGTYRLRTIVSEYMHYATAPGGNGEKDFPNVFRKMMPNWKGDAIVPPAIGSSTTIYYNYVADTVWKQPNVKLTSYVQNIGTGEVLNCGATGDPAINYTMAAPVVTVQHGVSAAQNTFNFSSVNTGSASEQFSYTLTSNQPSDWVANFTIGGTPYTSSATVTTASNASNAIVINVTPGTTPFVAIYTMTVKSVTNPSAPAMKSNVYVISNVTDLIVNNSGNVGDGVTAGSAANWDSVYTTGLAYAGRLTVGKTDEKVTAMAIAQGAFTGVRNIYLNIGWTFPSLTDAEVAQFTTFLNAGGCLLISGQDVGWDTWGASPATGTANTKAFFTNFLNASWVWDGNSTHNSIKTLASDAIFGNMPTPVTVNQFYGATYFYPDAIKPVGLGTTIYLYNDTSIAGVRATNGTWKTVYLGAGIEMLGNAMDRRYIVKRAHDWFYGLYTGITDHGSLTRMLGQNYPNPCAGITNIPLEGIQNDMSLQVIDLTGRVIQTVPVPHGTELLNLNTANLAPGIYMYRLLDGQRMLAAKTMEITR
ncbi:MAG: T9SS type A sorting domain-containing protein [Bacteroidia bacterium]